MYQLDRENEVVKHLIKLDVAISECDGEGRLISEEAGDSQQMSRMIARRASSQDETSYRS